MADQTPRDDEEAAGAPGPQPGPEAGPGDGFAAGPDAAPPTVDPDAVPEDAIVADPQLPDDTFEGAPRDEAMLPAEEPPLTLDPPAAAPPPVSPPIPPVVPPPPSRRAARPPRGTGGFGRLLRRLVMIALIIGVVLPVGLTVIYRFVPPPVTILMIQRLFEGKGLDRRWVSIDRMSPRLPLAVIAAEDARYCSHYGFDFEAMEKALKNNKRRPTRIRGGSTISQQTAKNVFLWPQRSYVRKGLEAYFTVLIETLWGKKRIMEVYLNTAEWGPGVYGADAAARRYFGVGADQLTATQSARLAAILPSPLKWRAARPGPYVQKRSRRIGAASGTVRREGMAACLN